MNQLITAAAAAAPSKPKPLVDWTALGQEVVVSIVIGILLVAVVSGAISLAAGASTARGASRSLRILGAGLGAVVSVGAIVAGIVFIIQR